MHHKSLLKTVAYLLASLSKGLSEAGSRPWQVNAVLRRSSGPWRQPKLSCALLKSLAGKRPEVPGKVFEVKE